MDDCLCNYLPAASAILSSFLLAIVQNYIPYLALNTPFSYFHDSLLYSLRIGTSINCGTSATSPLAKLFDNSLLSNMEPAIRLTYENRLQSIGIGNALKGITFQDGYVYVPSELIPSAPFFAEPESVSSPSTSPNIKKLSLTDFLAILNIILTIVFNTFPNPQVVKLEDSLSAFVELQSTEANEEVKQTEMLQKLCDIIIQFYSE